MEPLCVLCRGRGWCGKEFCPILARFKLMKIVELKKEFLGTSPPGIFVGHCFYPKVYTGILAPPQHIENGRILDRPELWYAQKASIEDVLGYRGQIIYSRFRANVKKPVGKLIELQQELVQSTKSLDVEIKLKRKPKFQMNFDIRTSPIANQGLLKEARLVDSPKILKLVDRTVSDTDMRAVDAVAKLYSGKISVSTIEQVLACGLLGQSLERKLVPTRWSITATDDIVSSRLLENIKGYPEISEFQLFSNTYLGNHYEILLMPRFWSYELIEAKFPRSVWNMLGKDIVTYSNSESFFRRKEYAEETAGGYYAVRLAICEHLDKIKRQATALVIRECLPDYWAPLGVWVCRETCRGAFGQKPEVFPSLESALENVKKKLKISWAKIKQGSWLLKELKEQKTVAKFLSSCK